MHYLRNIDWASFRGRLTTPSFGISEALGFPVWVLS